MLRGGGPAPSSSVSKMVATAKAVAAELASPPASPETKRNEKRKLVAMTELVESKAKVAKTSSLIYTPHKQRGITRIDFGSGLV